MKAILEPSWREILKGETEKNYFAELTKFVEEERKRGAVYPAEDKTFAAFALTPFESVKVVILGQDPYHEPGQAQGLAFYVPDNVTPPPSLVNIAKELADDSPECGAGKDSMPDLVAWASQGVLLRNATLTVAAHQAASHQGHGRETFT